MVPFKKNKILTENKTVSERLRSTRIEQGISLKKATKKTKVKLEYIKALESGNYEKLPGGIYEKIYTKKYASFLGLDAKKIIEKFQKEKEVVTQPNQTNISFFSKNKLKRSDFVILPRIMKNVLIVVIIAACFGYIGFYLKNFTSPPQLNVVQPQDDLVTTENQISVMGETGSGVEIYINGNPILTNNLGKFQENIALKKGVNTITVTAQKKYSRKKTLKKQVLVK